MKKDWVGITLGLTLLAAPLLAKTLAPRPQPEPLPKGASVGEFRESWRVLEPITRRNLTIYPVISTLRADTSGFITLDEGVASGQVRILERGQLESSMIRRRDSRRWPEQAPQAHSGASVNELVLVNDSAKPLVLLAGEVISGGKQNRIIGADVIVPPKSEPMPLTVFCVEHGRWSEARGGFGSAGAIAHPEIRKEAQANKSQQGVWNSVARAATTMSADSSTQDYAHVLASPKARAQVDEAAQAFQEEYERELRESAIGGGGRGAVGVIVAINGELVWSDVFPTVELFRRYWPKLLRSYIMEAESRGSGDQPPWGRKLSNLPSVKQAEAFLMEDRGRVSVKMEPAAYRRTEIAGNSYQVVALEAIDKNDEGGLMLHYNKMARG
jgi:hypothetical protein